MRNSIVKQYSRCQRGLTLVELIVSMVIISIALGGVLMVMNFTTSHSADPMIQHQAVAIAEAYMEEILLQRYKDPDGYPDGTVAAKEGSRDLYDNVYDYHGLSDDPPQKQDESDIDALKGYAVTVEVEEIPDTDLNALGPNTARVKSKKITVTVNHNSETMMILTGYRTDYN